MKRLLLAFAIVGFLVLVGGSAVRAQDLIHYFDRKKQTNEVGKGVISDETPAEVTFKPTGAAPAGQDPLDRYHGDRISLYHQRQVRELRVEAAHQRPAAGAAGEESRRPQDEAGNRPGGLPRRWRRW